MFVSSKIHNSHLPNGVQIFANFVDNHKWLLYFVHWSAGRWHQRALGLWYHKRRINISRNAASKESKFIDLSTKIDIFQGIFHESIHINFTSNSRVYLCLSSPENYYFPCCRYTKTYTRVCCSMCCVIYYWIMRICRPVNLVMKFGFPLCLIRLAAGIAKPMQRKGQPNGTYCAFSNVASISETLIIIIYFLFVMRFIVPHFRTISKSTKLTHSHSLISTCTHRTLYGYWRNVVKR